MRAVTQMIFAFAAAGAALAQGPAFEVASVKPVTKESAQRRPQLSGDAGRIDYTNVNLRILIARAYGVRDFQFDDLEALRAGNFDVAAKLPAGSTQDQVPAMLQALLAERFKLVLHRELKTMPVYALVAGKNGPKLKPSDSDHDGTLISISAKGRRLEGAATMPALANTLSGLVDRPVLDMTGLAGRFAIDIEWLPDDRDANSLVGQKVARARAAGMELPDASPDASAATSIFNTVQSVLGLKLEPRKSPVDFLIIDHVEKVPTEN